jgi:hypothetical protein
MMKVTVYFEVEEELSDRMQQSEIFWTPILIEAVEKALNEREFPVEEGLDSLN